MPSAQQIKNIQTVLRNMGYYNGTIDGVWGPQTKAAWNGYQITNGLPVTDGWDDKTQAYMDRQMAGLASSSPPVGGGGGTSGGGGSAPAGDGGGGGGGGGGGAVAAGGTDMTNASPDEIRKVVYEKYPHLAPYLDHPELGGILMDAARHGWGQAELQGKVYATTWWKTTSETARKYDLQRNTDPATWHQQRHQMAVKISSMTQQAVAGLTLSWDDYLAATDQALRFGWDDQMIRRWIAGQARTQFGKGLKGGSIKDTAEQFVAQAHNDWLVPVNEGRMQEFAARIFEGTLDASGVETYMRNQARHRFSWLSEEIDRGLAPGAIFEPLVQQVAQTLELSPQDISLLKEPKWQELLNPVTEGKTKRVMNLAEAGQWARSQKQWRKTRNYHEESASVTRGLLEGLGKASF